MTKIDLTLDENRAWVTMQWASGVDLEEIALSCGCGSAVSIYVAIAMFIEKWQPGALSQSRSNQNKTFKSYDGNRRLLVKGALEAFAEARST